MSWPVSGRAGGAVKRLGDLLRLPRPDAAFLGSSLVHASTALKAQDWNDLPPTEEVISGSKFPSILWHPRPGSCSDSSSFLITCLLSAHPAMILNYLLLITYLPPRCASSPFAVLSQLVDISQLRCTGAPGKPPCEPVGRRTCWGVWMLNSLSFLLLL